MIRSIRNIKSFGVFADFKWPASLPEFRQYNLFYGWNYSGKTTLSRVFRCVELNIEHTDFSGGTFQLQDDTQVACGLRAPPAGVQFRVFNTDCVRENLKFDSGDANPILYLGTEDIVKREELAKKRLRLEALQSELRKTEQDKTNVRDSLDSKLTKQAKEMKTDLSLPTYDRTKLEARVRECAQDSAKYLLDDAARSQKLSIALSGDKRPPLAVKVNSLKSLGPLRSRVAEVLRRDIVRVVSIPRLTNRSRVEHWVQLGRSLHEGEKECLFCGQALPIDLLADLRLHFSVEYDRLVADINALKLEVEVAAGQTLSTEDSGVFYPELAEAYLHEKNTLESLIDQRRRDLAELKQLLQERQNDPFTPTALSESHVDTALEIAVAIDRVNATIKAHNERTADFDLKKKAAIEALERHFACQFALSEDYLGKRAQIEELAETATKLEGDIRDCATAVQNYERELSAPNKGAEVINDLLRAYFGHSSVQITVTDQQRYHILRDGVVARNLSEGEQTAICFSYFITRVIDGRQSLSETIVVIDDPISSLDSGHLFNTYALIKARLAGAHQLFMFTHSFEFFILLRSWLEDLKQEQWGAYLVCRAGNGNSRIEELPPILKKFRSEYHYLFQKLYFYDQSDTTDVESDLGMPNIVRRFLEAFAGVMIPLSIALRKKMERLFADEVERERVFKFINDFSHNTTMIRSLTIPDSSECKSVVRSCLAAVKNWNAHYYKDLEDEVLRTS